MEHKNLPIKKVPLELIKPFINDLFLVYEDENAFPLLHPSDLGFVGGVDWRIHLKNAYVYHKMCDADRNIAGKHISELFYFHPKLDLRCSITNTTTDLVEMKELWDNSIPSRHTHWEYCYTNSVVILEHYRNEIVDNLSKL